jgi:hypothetical protein
LKQNLQQKMDTNFMNQNTTPFIPERPSRFRGEILRRVYRVWLFRKFLPVVAGEIAILAFILYQFGKIVFVERIVENAVKVLFSEPGRVAPFFLSAFLEAPVLTKTLSILAALLVAFLLRHLTQGMLRFILVRENYFAKEEGTAGK